MKLVVQPITGGIDNGKPRPIPPDLRLHMPSWPETDYRHYPDGWVCIQSFRHADFSMHYYHLNFRSHQVVEAITAKPTITLQFTLAGSAVVEMTGAGQLHSIKKNIGEIFYLVSGVNRAKINPGPFISLHLEFVEHFLRELSPHIPEFNKALNWIIERKQTGASLVSIPINVEVQQSIRQLLSAKTNGANSQLFLKSLVMQLLAAVSSCIMEENEMRHLPNVMYKAALIEIKQSISRNPNLKDFTLERLSKKYRIEPSTISKRFYELFQLHWAEYLRLRIMEKALLLLTSSDKPITEIAAELGYNSNSNFTRAFLRYYNETPSEARKTKGCAIQ